MKSKFIRRLDCFRYVPYITYNVLWGRFGSYDGILISITLCFIFIIMIRLFTSYTYRKYSIPLQSYELIQVQSV